MIHLFFVPTLKISSDIEKSTLAAKKQVLRISRNSQYIKDQICLWDEVSEDHGLLIPIVKNGELIYNFPSVQQIQKYTTEELTKLPKFYKTLSENDEDTNDSEYPVEISPQLVALQKKIIKEKTKP